MKQLCIIQHVSLRELPDSCLDPSKSGHLISKHVAFLLLACEYLQMPRATRGFVLLGLAIFECQALSLNLWRSGRRGSFSRIARMPNQPTLAANPSECIPTRHANAPGTPTSFLSMNGRLPLGTRLLNAAMPRRQEGMPEEYVRMVRQYLKWI